MKAEMAREVVDKIFNAFRQWFFTVTFCEFTYFENSILKYTETFGDGYPVMLLNGCQDPNTTKIKPKLNKHGQTAYIVTSNELTLEGSQYAIEALSRTGVFKPRSTVIFVLNKPVEVDSYFHYSMLRHFEMLWSRNIANSVVLIWSDHLQIYLYNPFTQKIRDVTYVPNITDLLMRQYEDLQGFELKLSVFRKIYTSDETGPVQCNSRLAATVMKDLNATCKPLAPRDGNTVGDILPNGTATGVTADLLDSYTDLELSSRILKNSYYGYIDTTYPFGQDEMCFLIKKSIYQSTFMTTLALISVKLLLIFVSNIIIFIFVCILIRKVEGDINNIDDKRSMSVTVVDLLKCFIRQTVDIRFVGPIFRFVVMLIILYSLIVDCAIEGIITSAIAYPRYKPDKNTLSELLSANYTFGVHNRHYSLFKKSLSKEIYDEVLKRTEILNDKQIKGVIDKRKSQYALLLRFSDAKYISRKPANMKNGKPIYHTTAECPVPCSIVYGLSYGSPYLPKIENILNYLNQAGILEYWTRSDEYTLYQNHGKVGGDNKTKKTLSLENLKEVLIMWLIGLLVSTLAFFTEVLFFVFQKKCFIV
ncbi:Ionotropic receptor 85a [Danaus plexippus plexippus]|uniref:Ionotropic receptor 85a n=1 Tax=Danaus plexippus plexippus TaxID=278856 RepID=A0A212EJG7_DANPL|nr:Ionotropic receptor 85a [Danaus plexippus plexippus]